MIRPWGRALSALSKVQAKPGPIPKLDQQGWQTLDNKFIKSDAYGIGLHPIKGMPSATNPGKERVYIAPCGVALSIVMLCRAAAALTTSA
jgi:hypothetical protein